MASSRLLGMLLARRKPEALSADDFLLEGNRLFDVVHRLRPLYCTCITGQCHRGSGTYSNRGLVEGCREQPGSAASSCTGSATAAEVLAVEILAAAAGRLVGCWQACRLTKQLRTDNLDDKLCNQANGCRNAAYTYLPRLKPPAMLLRAWADIHRAPGRHLACASLHWFRSSPSS